MTEADLALEADDDDLRPNGCSGSPPPSSIPFWRSRLADGTRVSADGVVIATGSRARGWPRCETMAGVHVIRTIDDAIALRADLRAGALLVVIGAGFIGAEVASTARKLGMDVTVVEAAPARCVQLGPWLGAVVAQAHAERRADLWRRRGRRDRRESRASHRRLCRPGHRGGPRRRAPSPCRRRSCRYRRHSEIEWLQGSGLELGNGVICGSNGQTNIPNVVAVGDCAAWHDVSTGAAHRVEHWTGALERPAIAVSSCSPAASIRAPSSRRRTSGPPYGSRIQFAGIAHPDDEITIEEGSCDDRCFLATYRRDGLLVAVLGVDQPRLFTRWRRQLATAHAAV